MRVHFRAPHGVGDWNRIVEMPAVPRVGDQVEGPVEEGGLYTVLRVQWSPWRIPEGSVSYDYDVYVVLSR